MSNYLVSNSDVQNKILNSRPHILKINLTIITESDQLVFINFVGIANIFDLQQITEANN